MTDQVPAGRGRRAQLMTWLRVVVSLGLVAFLVRKTPDLREAFPDGATGRIAALLAFAVVVAFVGVVLSAWRWQRCIALFQDPPTVASLLVTTLAGLFVNNVLPGTIGGDVVRVARASDQLGSAEHAFGSVVIERLTGFVVLPLMVVLGLIARPSLLHADDAWVAPLVASSTLALLATVMFLAGHPRVAGRYVGRTNWLRFVGAVHEGIAALRHSPRRALGVLGAAFVYQASVVVSVALIAAALEMPVPFIALLVFIPTVAMVQVLPISLNGLGVREGMLVLLLRSVGATRGQAIALGLLWAGSLLAVSLLGAPAFATGKRSARSAPPVTQSR